MKTRKRSRSSLRWFLVAILCFLAAFGVAHTEMIEYVMLLILAGIVLFLIGAVVNHLEHTRR